MGVKRQAEWASAINVALVGDAKVGKTSLVNRVTSDKFSEVRKIGSHLLTCRKKVLQLKAGKVEKMHPVYNHIFSLSKFFVKRKQEP